MTPALTLEELLQFSDESTRHWLQFLAEHPAVQQLPCGIYNAGTVLSLVRHIVAVELRYSQRLTGLDVIAYEHIPDDSLAALGAMHTEAVERFSTLLHDSTQNWNEVIEFQTLTAGTLRATRRKVLAHALLHSVRHWAQLSTLARAAGHPPPFAGDLLVSSALD